MTRPDGAPRLRPATREDVPAIAAIERQAFGDPWPARAFFGLLDVPHAAVTVADHEGAVVGYTVLVTAADEGELANVAVAPVARRGGIGRRLVAAAAAAAAERGVTQLFLEVRESNTAARALYEALGFAMVGRRRAYYRAPDEDALVLRLELPPADGGTERSAARSGGEDAGARAR